MFSEPELVLGLSVIYYDDDKQPHAAVVAKIYWDRVVDGSRPGMTLAWLGYDGRWKQQTNCEPAYHDGEKWILLQKWAFVGEIEEKYTLLVEV